MFNKILAFSICALSLSTLAVSPEFSKLHQSGLALQIAGGGNSAGYYTADHTYTFGVGGLTFASEKTDKVDTSTSPTTYKGTTDKGFDTYLFIRKNIPLTDSLVFSFGISGGKKFPTSGDTREIKKDYNAQQYVMFEHALTSKLLLGAWINTVNFSYNKVTDGNTDGENTNNISVMQGGSVQLAYMLA